MRNRLAFLSIFTFLLFCIFPTTALGVDRTKPVISEVSPTPKITNNKTSIKIKFKLSEGARVTLGIYQGSKLIKTGIRNVYYKSGYSTWLWTGTKKDGAYTVRIDARDSAGNKAFPKTTSITLDSVKPDLRGLSTPSEYINSDTDNLQFSYYLTEKARVGIKVNGSSIQAYQEKVKGSYTYKWNGQISGNSLNDGIYKVEFTAIDMAGNTIVKAIYITKDTQINVNGVFQKILFNPEIEDNIFTYMADEEVQGTLQIRNSAGKLVWWDLLDTTLENLLNTPITSQTENPPMYNEPLIGETGTINWGGKDLLGNLLSEGEYDYTFIAYDEAGNMMELKDKVAICDGIVPIIKPEVIDDSFKANGINDLPINFNLSKNANVTVQVYQGPELINEIYNDAKIRGLNTVNWDGKNESGDVVTPGDYIIKIIAEDIGGNEAVENVDVKVADGISPVISDASIPEVFAPDGIKVVDIGFDLSENANVDVEVYQGEELIKTIFSGEEASGPNVIQWDGTDINDNIITSGDFTIRINAVDAENNAAVEVTGSIVIDTVAPVILGIENNQTYNVDVTPETVDIDIDAVTITKDSIVIDDYELGTPITDEGQYELRVTDKGGNETILNFVIDKNPVAPTEVTANDEDVNPGVDGRDISVNWFVSSSNDIMSQRIFIVPAGTAFDLFGLTPMAVFSDNTTNSWVGDDAQIYDSTGNPLTDGLYDVYVVSVDGSYNYEASYVNLTITAD